MGAGIALVAARAGYDVEIVEPLEAARQRAAEAFRRETERTGDAAAPGRIAWSGVMPAHSDAVLAIEAVPERWELKREVLAALAAMLPPESLLASNTSSLSIGELAEQVAHPGRFLGMHFFNPPARMRLVEVVAGPQTSDAAIERAFDFVERFGKSGVLAADTPGFVVNRVARPYYLQAMRALERGAAPAQELDALARAAGFRMGPFELMDFIGLDVNLATSESVYERTGAARLEPVALQSAMVAENRLGRKTGAGFYDYGNGEFQRFELAVPEPPAEINEDEVVTVLGFNERAAQLAELLQQRYRNVLRVETDEMLGEVPAETTIAIDAGDAAGDRSEIVIALDAALGAECVIFEDAYSTDLQACAARLRHPQRVVGYGLLGALDEQNAVEIVDSEDLSDEALGLAEELFHALGKAVVLVEDIPGLFLGRVVGSIVNEAMIAVAEGVATPEDVDLAMELGANYPRGPIAWGRAIGGARLRRILKRLADAEGEEFAPHRSLWVLDVEEAVEAPEDAS